MKFSDQLMLLVLFGKHTKFRLAVSLVWCNLMKFTFVWSSTGQVLELHQQH